MPDICVLCGRATDIGSDSDGTEAIGATEASDATDGTRGRRQTNASIAQY